MGLAKQLLIPKVGPLLLAQFFAYGLIVLIGLGVLLTKWAKPGLGAWGITIETTADRVEKQAVTLAGNTAKIKCLERRLVNIETGVRILLEEVAPERAVTLPPVMRPGHGG